MKFLSTAAKAGVLSMAATAANAAVETGASGEWMTWLVLGAIALLVVGIALKMFLSARFAKGYGAWARSKRDTFAARNEQWDSEDERR